MTGNKGPGVAKCGEMPVWRQFIIPAPRLCGGKSLARFIEQLVSEAAPELRDVVVASVEGAGDPVRGVTQLGCGKIPIPELLSRLSHSEQLDWGDFFFFEEVGDAVVSRICDDLSISEAVETSSLTIRIIDDSQIHIFARRHDIPRFLTGRFAVANERTGSAERM